MIMIIEIYFGNLIKTKLQEVIFRPKSYYFCADLHTHNHHLKWRLLTESRDEYVSEIFSPFW